MAHAGIISRKVLPSALLVQPAIRSDEAGGQACGAILSEEAAVVACLTCQSRDVDWTHAGLQFFCTLA